SCAGDFAMRVASLSNSAKLGAAGLTGVRKMSNRFTQYILIAMALGIVMGTLVFNYLPDIRADIAADVNLIAMLFLRLIKMIIAPLVFATLVGRHSPHGKRLEVGPHFRKDDGLVRQRLVRVAAARID